jgi:hypothetical protein
MKTYARNISYVDAMGIMGTCSKVKEEISDGEKMALAKLSKRFDEIYKDSIEDFGKRRDVAIDEKSAVIKYTDSDKKKISIELSHVEITVIANCFLAVLKSKESNWGVAKEIMGLSESDTLNLSAHIENNVKGPKKLIDMPEDKDLIPEESDEDPSPGTEE